MDGSAVRPYPLNMLISYLSPTFTMQICFPILKFGSAKTISFEELSSSETQVNYWNA